MKSAMIVKMTIQDGQRAAAAELLAAMIPVVEGEEGTELYILHEDKGDENVLWMYELYASDDAIGVHGSSAEIGELFTKLGPLLAGAPEMTMLAPTVASGHGL